MTWFYVAMTLLGVTQFTPVPERKPGVILEGFFVSCPDNDDTTYGERIYLVRTANEKKIVGELHLGPRDELAFFFGDIGEEHIEHTDARNQLGSAFHAADIRPKVGGRNWSFGGFHLNVVQIGGSEPECYAALVRLSRLPRPTYVAP